jgi:hypothetical protein
VSGKAWIVEKKELTREEALKVWRLMSLTEREDLWRENCESDHFSSSWTFTMFSMSTSVMWQSMSRRFNDGKGVLNLNEQEEEV